MTTEKDKSESGIRVFVRPNGSEEWIDITESVEMTAHYSFGSLSITDQSWTELMNIKKDKEAVQ